MSLTYSAAVEQTITAGEQIHQIVNGTATTEVTVEDGSKVPSIRKALLDNFYFKDPIAWQVGQTENVFNQLRQFTDGSWWYAPSATASNPISMGSTPVGDPLWKVYDFDAIGKLTPQIREALRRSYAEAGYNLVDGSFEAGGLLTSTSDVMITASGSGYSWTGNYPVGGYYVAPGTDPTLDPLWVLRKNDILRSALASDVGTGMLGFSHTIAYAAASAGFRLKNSVYATDAPFNAPTDGTDASSHINAALTYCASNNKDLILDRMFKIGGTVTIPSSVTVICLTRQCGLDSTAVGANKAVSIAGMNSKFIGGTIKGINNPASATIRQDGIFLDSASSFCELIDVHVYGFFAKGFTGAGTGVGVSDRGVSNKIKYCRVIDSKFCVSLGGKKGEVVGNFISNHFLTQTTESKPWTSTSNFWDGIVSEGIEDYLIAFNTVTECGQSGIYTGGSGGLSKSNRIIGNVVDKCWNRGIDQGVTVAQSVSNDVIGQNIVGNICRNNRENNIWLAGTTRCNVTANTSIYDAEYATLFAGYYGGHIGIALTNGAVGTVPFGNSITGNNCYDSSLNANISISCGVTATGNTVDGNTTPQGIYLVDNILYATNNFDFLKAPTFTPTLIEGSGTVTLSEATGTTNIKGRRVSFVATITVSSVDTPSGHLSFGYIPPLSGTTLRFTDVRVSNYDGLDSTIGNSQLVAYISSELPDQVNIARVNNGTRIFDMRAFLKAGSTITVSGEVEFYA